MFRFLKRPLIKWLMRRRKPRNETLCDFDRIKYEIRLCDILLIEGRSRVSEVIKQITQSAWSHAMLYVGRIHDIENPVLRKHIKEYYDGDESEQLVIESVLGKGTVVTPLEFYRGDHIRICRPKGISRADSQKVIGFSIGRLGMEYGIRQNLDLARFFMPWSIFPRRWRSSLFGTRVGIPTREICSSMLAEAFGSVKFPILPLVKQHKEKGIQLFQRNPRLFVPADFDYSPYFEIIKYPIFELGSEAVYRNLPWNEDKFYSDEPISQDEEKSEEEVAKKEEPEVKE